jgi:putative endonuclease
MEGFTKEYDVKVLVHFERFGDVHLAIRRETRLKKWKRRWKIGLIEETNPHWRDLYASVIE